MFNPLVQGLGFFLALALILPFRLRPGVVGGLAGVLLMLVLVNLALGFPSQYFGFDYRIFWNVGQDVWAGANPYAADRFREHPFLNPPTALPFFAAFALLPLDIGRAVWTIGNAVVLSVLVPFTHRALVAQERLDANEASEAVPWRLPQFVLCGLTGSLAVTTACFTGFATGQLSLVATVALLAALNAQGRCQPLRAGLWLALASIKLTTMLPFLLLFTRRQDRWMWLSFVAGGLALVFIATPAGQLPGRLELMMSNVKELQVPGHVNDYSFEGPQQVTMLGLDHALYRLGFRDRTWIQAGQYFLLLALGLGVAGQVIPYRRIPHAAACSLIAALSAIFLYHRVYDTVVLVVPLVYTIGWARAAQRTARWVFACAAAAILLVLYMPIDLLWHITRLSFDSGAVGWLIQAVFLPYATWCVLLVMFGVVVGARLIASGGSGRTSASAGES